MPRDNDEVVVKHAIQEILPQVATWLRNNGEDDADQASVVADLLQAVRRSSDGYDIARTLERHLHWSPDSELVEILEGFSTYSAHRKALKAWVANHGVVATFGVGDRALWRGRPGEVRAVDPETTLITFLPDDKRHSSNTESKDGRGLYGYIVQEDALTREETAAAAV